LIGVSKISDQKIKKSKRKMFGYEVSVRIGLEPTKACRKRQEIEKSLEGHSAEFTAPVSWFAIAALAGILWKTYCTFSK
jgi:hypothetical protein